VECRRPGTLGTASCAILQHGVELGFGDSEPIRCQSPSLPNSSSDTLFAANISTASTI
jgi:hypothetical protein